MIRVLIAEDETLVRAGIRTLLERQDGMTVVAEATDGEEALRAPAATGSTSALLDVRMPRRGGIEVLEICSTWPSPPACLLLTTFDDRDALLAGVRAGARGYLRKDVTIQTLARAIRVLAEGGTFFQPSLTEKLLRGVSRVARLAAPEPVFMDPLTARETEVMRLVAGGYSNREIGEALSAAEATVKVHVSSILSKLGVRDRVQAVLRALEGGLI